MQHPGLVVNHKIFNKIPPQAICLQFLSKKIQSIIYIFAFTDITSHQMCEVSQDLLNCDLTNQAVPLNQPQGKIVKITLKA